MTKQHFIALAARVAELEEKAERYRLTTLRQDARIAELEADVSALQSNLALARGELEQATKPESCVANATGRVQWAHAYCGSALTRAEFTGLTLSR